MSSAADYDLSNPFSKRRWSHNMTAVVLLQQHPGQTATTSLSSASRSANILVCNLILDWDKAPNLLQQQASAHDLEIASCICPSILEEKKKLDGLTQTATTTKAQNPHTHSLSLSLRRQTSGDVISLLQISVGDYSGRIWEEDALISSEFRKLSKNKFVFFFQ